MKTPFLLLILAIPTFAFFSLSNNCNANGREGGGCTVASIQRNYIKSLVGLEYGIWDALFFVRNL